MTWVSLAIALATPLAILLPTMPYSEFTLEKVIAELGVSIQEDTLFPALQPLNGPVWLEQLLGKQSQLALISEKARSEFIISPILLACRELSQDQLSIFSGQRLDVDSSRGLTGECDFILTLSPALPPLRAPILMILEAKKNDIESGLGQCIAEMFAAVQFNNQAASQSHEANYETNYKTNHETDHGTIYGCITTGEVWQFLKLSQSTAWIDAQRYYLNSVSAILAAIHHIVQNSKR